MTVGYATFTEEALILGFRATRRVLEGIDVIFHREQVLIKVLDAVEGWQNSRNGYVVQIVKVHNKLVSIGPHLYVELLKLLLSKIGSGVQTFREGIRVRHRL